MIGPVFFRPAGEHFGDQLCCDDPALTIAGGFFTGPQRFGGVGNRIRSCRSVRQHIRARMRDRPQLPCAAVDAVQLLNLPSALSEKENRLIVEPGYRLDGRAIRGGAQREQNVGFWRMKQGVRLPEKHGVLVAVALQVPFSEDHNEFLPIRRELRNAARRTSSAKVYRVCQALHCDDIFDLDRPAGSGSCRIQRGTSEEKSLFARFFLRLRIGCKRHHAVAMRRKNQEQHAESR